jgi:energy-coupling factor transporter ATP-binding protein EcfA2
MKIHTLEIQNIRGIRNLRLAPHGKNFVVWGPNGSGKSAVVDAIDFLLTGKVSRLTGTGTKGISLSKHGPHIDCRPEEALVRATVEIPGQANLIQLRRCMADPSSLEVSPPVGSRLEPMLIVAARGQHVLSRRDILRFITSEAGKRAQDIQELLNLTDIEATRKCLVAVANNATNSVQETSLALQRARIAAAASIGLEQFSPDEALDAINRNRQLLGAAPAEGLHSRLVKEGVGLPAAEPGRPAVNLTLLEKDVEILRAQLSPDQTASRRATEESLREKLGIIRKDPGLQAALSQKELISLGLGLIQDEGNCPLCDKPWPAGELKPYLESKLARASVADNFSRDILAAASSLSGSAAIILGPLNKLIAALQLSGLAEPSAMISEWVMHIKSLEKHLSNPLHDYPRADYSAEAVSSLFAPKDLDQELNSALATLRVMYPEATPEQTAWDALTRIEENLKSMEAHLEAAQRAAQLSAKALALRDAFLQARDEVLTGLYDSIRERFSHLYRKLHGPDESQFQADIHPEGAGLALEVDFYGRGAHPPHALHSEGHQDSMGLCLYLALSEELSQGVIDLTILDDVVMSVDSNHRRQVCALLSDEYPNRQFLITTHDQTWANQLRTVGLVEPGCRIEFANWSLETGPLVNLDTEMWQRIETALNSGDMPAAAILLRRGSEEFFSTACDALGAPIAFRLDGRYELGDLLPAAVSRYGRLLAQAKSAVQSWSQDALFQRLMEIHSALTAIFTRTQAEQWAVNATLHYNNWANLSREDFRPVLEAFRDLHEAFICQQCRSIIRILRRDHEDVAIRCDCSLIDWNLLKRTSAVS